MSTPTLAAGGQTFTVAAGPAVLITESAPITLINTSTGSRIWLAADSAVSPGSGVPLDPGTSYRWDTRGAVWAILDPAASAPAALVATGTGTVWAPSPVAIGAAVAAELVTSGLPTQYRTDYFGQYDLGGTSWTSILQSVDGTRNIANYAAIQIYVATSAPQTGTLPQLNGVTLQWETFSVSPISLYYNSAFSAGLQIAVTLPVAGIALQLVNLDPYDATVAVWGCSQPASGLIGLSPAPFGFTASSGSKSTPTATAFTISQGQIFGGRAYVTSALSFSGGPAPSGAGGGIEVLDYLGGVHYQPICPQIQSMPLIAPTLYFWQGEIALPRLPYVIYGGQTNVNLPAGVSWTWTLNAIPM